VKQELSRQGIGASEISTVCGMNPFQSPWDLWQTKIGEREPFEGNAMTDWGHRLEPVIRQAYVDQTGAVVYVPMESIFSKETPWARATPDGIVLSSPIGDPSRDIWQHLLQIKNVGFWVGRDWEQAPPAYVQLQEQWELYVTGLQRADVAALVAGNDFRVFTIHRDDKVIRDLLAIATDFWRRVEQRIPPEIDNSEACKEHFEKRFAKANAVELVATSEIESLFEQWRTHAKTVKAASKEVERIRNVVRSHFAEAQADRIISSIGVAKLDVNHKLLAPKEWAKDVA
jgi:putative phage-type endonuclease